MRRRRGRKRGEYQQGPLQTGDLRHMLLPLVSVWVSGKDYKEDER